MGVTGDGKLTNYINVYRTKTGQVHGCPGNWCCRGELSMRDMLKELIVARNKKNIKIMILRLY